MSSGIQKTKKWFGVELVAVSITERLVASIGGAVGIIGLTFFLQMLAPGYAGICLLGSMGASSVLLFGVPHSPLSQPWPIIGGHTLSAFAGVVCARWLEPPLLAGGLAVGLAIGLMHLGRCIHPPGGATALTAVIGGSTIHDWGFAYILFPVLASVLLLVFLATVINAPFPWRRYPSFLSRASTPLKVVSPDKDAQRHRQIVAALREIDSFVDISEEDLIRLVNHLSSQERHEVSGPRNQP